MEFGLVDLRHHIGSAGGSDIGKVVSDVERNIVGETRGRNLWDKGIPRQHGGNKGRDEVYR